MEVCDAVRMYDLVELSQVEGVAPGARIDFLVRPTENIDDCKVQIAAIKETVTEEEQYEDFHVDYDSERKGHNISFSVPESASSGT